MPGALHRHQESTMPAEGLPREVVALIGQESELSWGPLAVSQPLTDHWCEVFEDAYPGYTDPVTAEAACGGIVAPPLLLMTVLFPYRWLPPGAGGRLQTLGNP
jgi:hypothetical protein